MRRIIARALGALALGGLLAVGVDAVAASADSPAPAVASASAAHARPADWWA